VAAHVEGAVTRVDRARVVIVAIGCRVAVACGRCSPRPPSSAAATDRSRRRSTRRRRPRRPP
jgi:hypothetical protein